MHFYREVVVTSFHVHCQQSKFIPLFDRFPIAYWLTVNKQLDPVAHRILCTVVKCLHFFTFFFLFSLSPACKRTNTGSAHRAGIEVWHKLSSFQRWTWASLSCKSITTEATRGLGWRMSILDARKKSEREKENNFNRCSIMFSAQSSSPPVCLHFELLRACIEHNSSSREIWDKVRDRGRGMKWKMCDINCIFWCQIKIRTNELSRNVEDIVAKFTIDE